MQNYVRMVLLGLCAVIPACGTVERRVRLVPYAKHAQAQFTPEQEAQITENCGDFGMPRKEWSFGATDYVTNDGYVLEHSRADRIPMWVAEHLKSEQWEGNAPRPGAQYWKSDQRLPAAGRGELADYKSSGYDRGHMAPNGDFGPWEARVETFILSNAVPQFPSQNQGVWAALEGKVRNLVKSSGGGYVITGAMFYEAEEDPDSGSGGDGTIAYTIIGENQVAVPTHTFKIVIVSPSQDAWQAYGFVIPNETGQSASNWASHMRSVDWIEMRTGMNFFPALAGADENQIESVVLPAPF